ncbi:NADH dehydrogenase [ubiquinone] 1 alpha subcomplex subunit 13 [Nylanderia fulva]|uniref:NADH dehydrogenase [ubiquinone] 1 alpha subcomplex subunit 13 n=1 Tax=Nylanderia fulva TaxID=613905 RepID=UPI0010FB3C1F|nr:NADH dehydrogenase [ubiquinone] 1 alpha subcomplex subunit 13 [Nylanderia fulva]
MDAATGKRMQDLPPKGGYGPIQTDRVKLRTILGAKNTFALFFATTVVGFYAYYLNYKLVKRNEIEMRSTRLAIWPALIAERDRSILKQMRRNRDEEAELMKNVEGWEVGTYYGEPIYFLDEENQFREPLFIEHFAHADPGHLGERSCRHLMS